MNWHFRIGFSGFEKKLLDCDVVFVIMVHIKLFLGVNLTNSHWTN